MTQFDRLVDVHVKGVFFLTQALPPLIADGGRIVNLSSGLTRMSYPGYGAYAAVKGAVETLTLYMAKELGSRGVASTRSRRARSRPTSAAARCATTKTLNKAFAAMTALGRVGVPDDIGPMIASLLSPANRWVNAQRIEVSGGQII